MSDPLRTKPLEIESVGKMIPLAHLAIPGPGEILAEVQSPRKLIRPHKKLAAVVGVDHRADSLSPVHHLHIVQPLLMRRRCPEKHQRVYLARGAPLNHCFAAVIVVVCCRNRFQNAHGAKMMLADRARQALGAIADDALGLSGVPNQFRRGAELPALRGFMPLLVGGRLGHWTKYAGYLTPSGASPATLPIILPGYIIPQNLKTTPGPNPGELIFPRVYTCISVWTPPKSRHCAVDWTCPHNIQYLHF